MKKLSLIPLGVAGLTLAGAYGFYRYIFYSPVGKQNDDRALPLPSKSESADKRALELIDRLNAKAFERVSITSFDGLRLNGRYYHVRSGAPLLLMCHGYRGTPSRDFSGGADICFSSGYNLLLIEERAHCSSGGHTITFGINERRDCADWCRWAAERFRSPIILVGISMGAATVLMASALDLPENVRGIIADCPFTSPKEIIRTVGASMGIPVGVAMPLARLGARVFGGFSLDASADAAEAVRHARVPILLIHGEADDFVPCAMGRKIAAANPELIELQTFPGAWHGASYLVDTARYTRLINSFCERVTQTGTERRKTHWSKNEG